MIAQLVQDLVHLERGGDGLDQHRRLDRAARDAELLLREDEHVVPQPRLEMALELRQVEIGPGAAREQLPWRCGRSRGRNRTGCRTSGSPSTEHVLLRQMPAARPHQQHRGLLVERDRPCRCRIVKVICRRTASIRLLWPSSWLSQVGESESSKSAMKTYAPELSALMTILRSTGPVISTRRSSRSLGIGATFQSPARICAVSLRKSGFSPASSRVLPLPCARRAGAGALARICARAPPGRPRLRRQDLLECGLGKRGNRNAGQYHVKFLQPKDPDARGRPRRNSHPWHAGPRPGNPYFGRGRSADDATRRGRN